MGIDRSSVVCFVIDTTGSMAREIATAKERVYQIIDSKKGTQDEPSEYILVPFNDPGELVWDPTQSHSPATAKDSRLTCSEFT